MLQDSRSHPLLAIRPAASLLVVTLALALHCPCRAAAPAESTVVAQSVLPDSNAVRDSWAATSEWTGIARGRLEAGKDAETKSALDSAVAHWDRTRALSKDIQRREYQVATADSLRSTYVEYLLRYPEAALEPDRIAAAYEIGQGFRARTLLESADGSGFLPAPPPSISAEDVQGQLDDGDLLLEWVCGPGPTRLFAFTHDRRWVFSIADSRTLAARIQAARGAVESAPGGGGDTKSARFASEELASLLFGDALGLVAKARALILVPEGPLRLVPFSALFVRGQPLVAARPVSVVPSMALLAEPRSWESTAPNQKLLAVQGSGSGGRLAAAEREVEWLAATFKGVTLSGSDRPAPDSAALGRYEALHFAGRVKLDELHPWRSGVDAGRSRRAGAVAGTPISEPASDAAGSDGTLRAENISRLQLSARVVVLSSRGATTGPPSGQGLTGLATAFLAAGGHAVVAPLWPLDDHATESLMREFYRTLAAGKTTAEALRAAQDHQRRTHGTVHPYYWAGFVVLGDGATTLKLPANPIWKRGGPGILDH
jgi:hypothetical protein